MRILSDEMSEVVDFYSYTIRSEVGINVCTHTELTLSQENFESEYCSIVNDFKNKPVSVKNEEILNVHSSCNNTYMD